MSLKPSLIPLALCVLNLLRAEPLSAAPNDLKESTLHYSDVVGRRALTARGWTLDESPEGKVIRKLHIISLPVFLSEERFSSITTPLNALHATTVDAVVRRESRVRVGRRWVQGDALETERNLRGLAILTSARVYAVIPLDTAQSEGEAGALPASQIVKPNTSQSIKSSASQKIKPIEYIDAVIVTRDLWSLRLESGFTYNAGVLNRLSLNLTERNLFGRRILVRGSSLLTPFSVTGGLGFNHRRFGPDLSLSASGFGTWGRASGEREGEGVELALSRPLYNLDQAWSFGVSGGVSRQRARLTVGDQIRVDDDPSTPELEETPIEWELRSWSIGASASRQWRGRYQRTLSVGVGISESARSLLDGVSTSQAERLRSLYLAPDRVQIGPSVSFSWYRRSYAALTNISTYGLREDLQLGPRISTSHQLSLIGDRAYLPALQLGYTSLLGGRGFISIAASGSLRVEGLSDDELLNRVLSVGLSSALPLRIAGSHLGFLIGRFNLLHRWRDVTNSILSMGGDMGLRGYASGAFIARAGGVSRNNIEYRSPPWKWSFIHFGFVFFYDGGSVHERFSDYRWRHSAGGGLRFLLPQMNRSVFRLDLALPLSADPLNPNAPAVIMSIGSNQGFVFMPWEG